MTASELARFLKEEVPRFQARIDGGDMPVDVEDLLSALACAVGLLSQAEGVIAQAQWGPDMNRCPYCNNPKPNHMGGCWLSETLTTLATLRLVVGDKEL